METRIRRQEKGVALILSILALLLLSAIAVSMMYMAATESSINANFKKEEVEYFASRAGIEEIRDRMIPGVVPYSLNGLAAGPNPPCPIRLAGNCYLPDQLPTAANGEIVYILQNQANAALTMANVTTAPTPGNPNPIYDDELCHDYAIGGMQRSLAANVSCANSANTQLPAGAAWYFRPPAAAGLSAAPFWLNGGSSNPLDWKWARISLKATNSAPYCVDGTANPGCAAEVPQKVCWDGNTESALPVGFASCGALTPPLQPVYLVTALAVSSTGGRRLIQTELAQKPSQNPPDGLYATGQGCPALSVVGGSATGSFNSGLEAAPADPPTNVANNGGDVGANGEISLQGNKTTVNGAANSAGLGGCNPGGVVTAGGATATTTNNNAPPYNPTVPPVPKNVPTGNVTPASPWGAGTYGDVTFTGGTINLPGGTPGNPAVYNVNSLSISGRATLNILGPVVINIACGTSSNPCPGGQAVSIGSNVSFNNASFVPGNFTIDYGMSANSAGNVLIKGNTDFFGVINAPNANVQLAGGTNFYGAAIGSSVSVVGGTNFFWDKGLQTPPPLTEPFTEITMRELSY
jgi:hypothetical protein